MIVGFFQWALVPQVSQSVSAWMTLMLGKWR
jgi:hypothetical protein